MSHLPMNPYIQSVQALATEAGGQAYLVGGAVRDWLKTGTLSPDLDFTLLDCHASELAQALATKRQGHLVPLDLEFGIHRVVFDDGICVDLSDALDNSLAIDLNRRDLTVNAMAFDLSRGTLIDPFGGEKDLAQGRIRMVSEANLLDDPLRMLRVFRIAAVLQAQEFDPVTLDAVRRNAPRIWESAAERIQYELFRLLSVEKCFPYLKAMADCGLLEVIIPDLAPMRQIQSSGFHHLGLFEHTMELVRQAERLIEEEALPPESLQWFRQPFNPVVTRLGLIKLGCLLHDIGKPSTLGEREDPVYGKRLTFYRHEEVGETMADPWLRRLKVSNDIRDYLKKLIRWHLYPCQFGPESPRKSVLRFYRRMGDDSRDVTFLALADRHSACGPWLKPEDLEKAHADHIWLLENYTREEATIKQPRLLNGHEVMEILDLPPGPHLKEILDALQEAQQLNEVQTADEARQWLLTQYQGASSRP